ncbi:tRNA (adenine-N(1))-methyltransferase [Lactobacillus sp. LC28-10]|uniref:tRNA (Adenine-N(1))-methyltransferase n=1 Tax=Secundilactobacillus angelensis TaxID=2722706 RepID=A0ABX1KX96_9LACO|nr:tRNA (adenine(22)-N(1))-methyltransferase TrmK [Secundilactobacillus angelensis]MCH5461342.1 tRNA (adenine(22)-N(1))-methyltransferase TrmK [Secundilactobacillus angelensis]NLR17845.1 tRNA (adenine-N(1))-methyltransferase [Secundilactobacillus angelensis]
MNGTHLSNRLQTVADFVQPGARLADIGSDHAYLPVHLAKQGTIRAAIAGEVVKGPYHNALTEIENEQLTAVITARLADGLAAIQPEDKIDTVTIAGMGGTLITKILEDGKAHLTHKERLILQPNVGEDNVRRWLQDNRYQIVAERILAEDGHIYEIIVADPVDKPVAYTAVELKFGPFLLKEKSPVLQQKWRREQTRLDQVIATMQQAKNAPKQKIAAFQQERDQIQEVILNEG